MSTLRAPLYGNDSSDSYLYSGEETATGRFNTGLQYLNMLSNVDHSKLLEFQTNSRTKNNGQSVKARRCNTSIARSRSEGKILTANSLISSVSHWRAAWANEITKAWRQRRHECWQQFWCCLPFHVSMFLLLLSDPSLSGVSIFWVTRCKDLKLDTKNISAFFVFPHVQISLA